jgi:hypothetical protein
MTGKSRISRRGEVPANDVAGADRDAVRNQTDGVALARTSGDPMMTSRATGTAVQKGERSPVTRTAGKTTREIRSGSRTRAAPMIVAPKRMAAVVAA